MNRLRSSSLTALRALRDDRPVQLPIVSMLGHAVAFLPCLKLMYASTIFSAGVNSVEANNTKGMLTYRWSTHTSHHVAFGARRRGRGGR
jgi:hypothetical protein